MFRSALFAFFFFFCLCTAAQRDSSAYYLQQIANEKSEIRAAFPMADASFYATADSLAQYAIRNQQAEMLPHLIQFLHTIDDVASFRNGSYKEVLRYGFLIFDWRKKNTLGANIRMYPSLSLRAFLLFADDTAAVSFLNEQTAANPQEVLRQADLLSARPFVKHAIENALLADPEYAKRYLVLDGAVSAVLLRTKRSEVQWIAKIYNQYGSRTRALLLLDAIVKQQLHVAQADSIGKNEDALWSALSAEMTTTAPLARFSIENEIQYQAVWRVRRLNEQPATTVKLNQMNANSLFLLSLAYNDASSNTFSHIIMALKAAQGLVSGDLIQNISPSRLAAYFKFLEDSGKLPDVLYKIAPAERNNLLNLLAFDEKTESLPVFHPEVHATEVMEPVVVVEKAEESDADIVVAPFTPALAESEKKLLRWKKNLFSTLQNLPSLIEDPDLKTFLMYAALYEPDEVLKKAEVFKSKFWCKDVLEAAALNAPVSAKRYLTDPRHPVSVILNYSENTSVKNLLNLSNHLGFISRPLVFLDALNREEITLDRAISISSNSSEFLHELMQIAGRKNYLAKYNVDRELNYHALRLVRNINDKMALPESQRFASVDTMQAETLYYVMVYGREEVFASTFTGLFQRFKKQALTSPKARDLASFPHFRSFIALCTNNQKLEDLLTLFSTGEQEALWHAFVADLPAQENPLTEASVVAEVLNNSNNNSVLTSLQRELKYQYARADSLKDQQQIALYGILVSLAREKAVNDRLWFRTIAKKFKLNSPVQLKAEQLQNNDVIVERMYFYNDEDGRDSYENFMASFRGKSDWQVEENYNYSRVSSATGKQIQIYSNKPALEESGDQTISKIFKENNFRPSVIIHRGHSFHTEKTLQRVPESARLVIVGSCGGFYQLNVALRNAPEAQFISTKQIGVKQINDPIILAINEALRQNKTINWKNFWEEMRSKLGGNSLFYDYVPPHKNLESLFVRMYYQLLGV
ncbi:MAG: hypothetical protein U0T73_07335 [Chitinophagales bacterium]